VALVVGGSEYAYSKSGGVLQVYAGAEVIVDRLEIDIAEAAGSLVEQQLELPEGARLERATFSFAASPAGLTEVSSVAQVRPGSPLSGTAQACVVDFGRMVTVSDFGLGFGAGDVSLDQVYRWTGAEWRVLGAPDSGGFAETSTDRLLVTATSDSSDDIVDAVVDVGEVRLPAQPTSLELLVDGTTVWFERQGSSPELTPAGVSGDAVYAVDRTDAVREAFARARVSGGKRAVNVALRAAAPGQLQMQPALAMLHVHLVQFGSDALSQTLDVTEEGVHQVQLAGPYGSADRIREVALVVRGSFGPERVQPVEGPPPEPEVRLVLAPGRTVLLGLPRALAGRFGELTGVRLHVRAPGSGGEIAGRLLASDDTGQLGEPLTGGELPPVQVRGGYDGWQTLSFAAAVPTPAGAGPLAAWLELAPSYGEVECSLTGAGPSSSPVPGAPVRRRLAGGGTAPIPRLGGYPELSAALRIVGRPERGRPLPAVEVAVAGAGAVAGANPTSDDLSVRLGVDPGVTPVGDLVPLVLRIAAAGSVTVDTVQVAYSKGVAT